MMTQATSLSTAKDDAHDARVRPTAPDVLIHLHIAKTGGTSLSSMVKHGFRNDEVFEWSRHGVDDYSGLGMATQEAYRRQLTAFGLERIRYVSGHMPMGVHRMFDRPAKYITVLRDPIERVVSLFHFLAQQRSPFLRDGSPMTFEDYVESREDINLNDYQVRAVSGCSDLDADAPEAGGLVVAGPVERRHLEAAKRVIDEHFLTIAPVEQLTEVALLVRRIYGWPLRRLQNEYKNLTKKRPRGKEISPRLIRIIQDRNSHDIELYEWVGKRFAEQKRMFEPALSRDLRVYGTVNRALTTVGQVLPWGLRKRLAEILFYAG